MEDAHIFLDENDCVKKFPDILKYNARVSIFGILDGHGGSNVSIFVSQNLPGLILTNLIECGPEFSNGARVTDSLVKSFTLMEAMVKSQCSKEGWTDGCCCVLALIVNEMLYLANLGDSKAILCRRIKKSNQPSQSIIPHTDVSGGSGGRQGALSHTFPWDHGSAAPPPPAESLSLTIDHKPTQMSERERIEKFGGRIENGRVVCSSGLMSLSLAVTRSFGDEAMKRYGVTAEPDVRVKLSLTSPTAILARKDKLKSRKQRLSQDGHRLNSLAAPADPLQQQLSSHPYPHTSTNEIVLNTGSQVSSSNASSSGPTGNTDGSSIRPETTTSIYQTPTPLNVASSSSSTEHEISLNTADAHLLNSTISGSISIKVLPSEPKPSGSIGCSAEDVGGQCEFLVLGCDGLWDRFSERSVAAFVRTRLYAGVSWREGREVHWTLPSITRALVEDAIFEKGSQDNVSAIVIQFIHGEGGLPNPPKIYEPTPAIGMR